MDILTAAIDWAKAELVSTPFFILFGILFIVASWWFWQRWKTDLARAYIVPTLVAWILLTIIGCGLFFTNKMRVSQFQTAYHADEGSFLSAEIERTESTLKEYTNVVFTAIPIIIAICAIVIAFVSSPVWKASMIITIAMLVVILLIDGIAYARIDNYNKLLLLREQELLNK